MPRCDFTMTITQFFVWLTLLNSLVSSMKTCSRVHECCQNIVLSNTYYTVEVSRIAGKAQLHLTCSENSTNDYQNERSCTFNDQYTRMFVYECSTEDMLAFIDHYRPKSLYRSRARSHFYGTEYEICADFGPDGNTEKKVGGPIMSNF